MAVDVAGDVALTMFARRGAGCVWEEIHVLALRRGRWHMLGGGGGHRPREPRDVGREAAGRGGWGVRRTGMLWRAAVESGGGRARYAGAPASPRYRAAMARRSRSNSGGSIVTGPATGTYP